MPKAFGRMFKSTPRYYFLKDTLYLPFHSNVADKRYFLILASMCICHATTAAMPKFL